MTSPLLPTKLVWKLKMMSMKKKMSTMESRTSIVTSVVLLDVLNNKYLTATLLEFEFSSASAHLLIARLAGTMMTV